MSEFQYYELMLSTVRSVRPTEQLRVITSCAPITRTRLVNTYEWGNFKSDPHQLVAKHFDASVSLLRELRRTMPTEIQTTDPPDLQLFGRVRRVT